MKLPIIFLLFFSPMYLLSQDTLQYEWILTRPSPLLFGNSEGWAVALDDNDNIYWGVNQDMPGTDVFLDATVYKFNSDTNEIWMEHAVTGEYDQQSYNIKITDSLIYFAGRTCNTQGVDSCQALLFTTDYITGITQQTTLWTQGFGYEEIDGMYLEDDGILLTGWTRSDVTAMDVLILKVDYQGNEIWRNIWGSDVPSRDDHQDGHIVVDDSMIYISGLALGSPGFGLQGQALLAKFNRTNGNFVDSVHYGRSDLWVNAENALGMTSDGEFLYCTGFTVPEPNNYDIFLTKYDKNLNQIWYTTWGGPVAESSRSVHVSDDGSIYLAGNTKSYGNGDTDVLFIKFDQAGTPLWYKTWGTDKEDETLDFYVDGNDFYITGKTKSYNQFNNWEAFLLKVNSDSTSVSLEETMIGQNFSYSLFPNPFRDFATLKFENPNHDSHRLEISSLDGKVLKRTSEIHSDEVKIEKSNLEKGAYFLRLMKDEETVITEKIIVH